ncbi:MAG: hypothetical protein GF330_05815 [Candidatus Eisenbacteria bacterium]|nr:hypothetical protein [Candidatus Eisenbacteria bacterium]
MTALRYTFVVVLILSTGSGISAAWEWQTEVGPVDSGRGTSIALDGSGNPRILHTGPWLVGLRYSYFADGSWHTEVLDPDVTTGDHSSLAIDGDDHLHISFWGADVPADCDRLLYGYYDGVRLAVRSRR